MIMYLQMINGARWENKIFIETIRKDVKILDNRLMAKGLHTICDIVYLMNDYDGSDMPIQGIDRVYDNLYTSTNREKATMASREVLRL